MCRSSSEMSSMSSMVESGSLSVSMDVPGRWEIRVVSKWTTRGGGKGRGEGMSGIK